MRAAGFAALVALVLLAGCDGVSSDFGLDAEMLVTGAQFVRGAMPGDVGGPSVVALDLSSNSVAAGEIEKPLRGSLDPEATAAAIGLEGDVGYWIVPTGLADVAAPGFPTFDVTLAFAEDLRAGERELVVRAVDAEDRFGASETRTLTASGLPFPEGALVVSLAWDREADLDVHVEIPGGGVIWKGDIVDAGGMLDFDSNAGCVVDGRRREYVIWKDPPPPGHYVVRVDAFSLCAESFANWKVDVRLAGESLGRAEGESGVTDTHFPHDRGAGVLALDFDVP